MFLLLLVVFPSASTAFWIKTSGLSILQSCYMNCLDCNSNPLRCSHCWSHFKINLVFSKIQLNCLVIIFVPSKDICHITWIIVERGLFWWSFIWMIVWYFAAPSSDVVVFICLSVSDISRALFQACITSAVVSLLLFSTALGVSYFVQSSSASNLGPAEV